MEARLLVRRQVPFFPENVSAGERRAATQRHFNSRCEPAQPVTFILAVQESSLGEIHLSCHQLHPIPIPRLGENAHGGGIAAKGLTSESVHLGDLQSHVCCY